VAVQPVEPRSPEHALVLTAPARHYSVAAPVEPPLVLDDDRPLVLQYEVTLREGLNCGGAYVKLLHATPELDAGAVTGETPYLVRTESCSGKRGACDHTTLPHATSDAFSSCCCR
jgi:hypothetical protein